MFLHTWEQKDVSTCSLQGFFFPSCSVQPLQSAVTQPETARCRPVTNAARTKHVRTVSLEKKTTWKRAEFYSLVTLSSTSRCVLTPASQVSLWRPRSTSFSLPAGGRNSPLSWINKSMVWTRIQSSGNPTDQYLPYLDETGNLWSWSAQFIPWPQDNHCYLSTALYGFYLTLYFIQQVGL